MPGFPAPFVKFREDDQNGFPLAGGRLYTYAAGTSTPLATYTTQALTVPNTNPIVLDASGRASIYIPDGVGYKFVLSDTLNNLIWSEDNVQVPKVAATPAALVIAPGIIAAFGGTTAPTGWLLCDGASVSTTLYPALFSAILYTFGGAGSSFNVPDLRQRFPLGKAVAGTGVVLGSTGGLIDHTHTVPRNGWGAITVTAAAVVGFLLSTVGGAANVDATTSDTVATGTANPPFLAVHFIIKT
jgi:microcystin-dependent protein